MSQISVTTHFLRMAPRASLLAQMLTGLLTLKIVVLEKTTCLIVYVYRNIFHGIMEHNRHSSKALQKVIQFRTQTRVSLGMVYLITSSRLTSLKFLIRPM